MTQFSTATYDEARPSSQANNGVIASIAVALAVGMGLGLFFSNIGVTSEARGASQASAMTHEQFLRINTEDMDHLAPLVSPGVTVTPAADPFIVMNVDSYRWLSGAIVDRHMVGSHFHEINTWGFEKATSEGVTSTGPGGDIISDSEPFGHPNYGRLQTYLGAEPEGGVR